jgi:ornithine carbamoyltransferase
MAPAAQRRVQRKIASVEQVPAQNREYDAILTRHFLTGEELTGGELRALIERALELKADRFASRALEGASVALMFERPSTRTRVSFEVGVYELGGHPVVLREAELQLTRGESVRDTALVLSRYVHAIGLRTGPHELIEELAAHSSVPVFNMLTREHHPCQALADLVTLRERFGELSGLKLAYVGDGNNMARSLVLLGEAAGVEVALASPPALALPGAPNAAPDEAVQGASAVYTDVWVSMGDEQEAARRRELLASYRLDEELLARAGDGAVALHCLPAHAGEEISEGALYGERSAVWDQAENRLHAQKALLELLVAG